MLEAPDGTLQIVHYENDPQEGFLWNLAAATLEKQEAPELLEKCLKASLTKWKGNVCPSLLQ